MPHIDFACSKQYPSGLVLFIQPTAGGGGGFGVGVGAGLQVPPEQLFELHPYEQDVEQYFTQQSALDPHIL